MISYGMAKARAMAGRDDWNEREAIKSATILWYDTEEEGYELEIENEDDLDAEDFRAWIEENADSLVQEDAAANCTTFEDIEDIEYETEWIDDDALFRGRIRRRLRKRMGMDDRQISQKAESPEGGLCLVLRMLLVIWSCLVSECSQFAALLCKLQFVVLLLILLLLTMLCILFLRLYRSIFHCLLHLFLKHFRGNKCYPFLIIGQNDQPLPACQPEFLSDFFWDNKLTALVYDHRTPDILSLLRRWKYPFPVKRRCFHKAVYGHSVDFGETHTLFYIRNGNAVLPFCVSLP